MTLKTRLQYCITCFRKCPNSVKCSNLSGLGFPASSHWCKQMLETHFLLIIILWFYTALFTSICILVVSRGININPDSTALGPYKCIVQQSLPQRTYSPQWVWTENRSTERWGFLPKDTQHSMAEWGTEPISPSGPLCLFTCRPECFIKEVKYHYPQAWRNWGQERESDLLGLYNRAAAESRREPGSPDTHAVALSIG